MGIKSFIESTKRVLTVAKKPDRPEYMLMLKVSALGILLIGLLGFLIGFLFAFFGLGRPLG